MRATGLIGSFLLLAFFPAASLAEHAQIFNHIPPGSTVYIEDFLAVGPAIGTELAYHPLALKIVGSKEQADYLIQGTAREHYPSYLRTVVLTNSRMYETSVKVVNAHTGEVAMTYWRDKRKPATEAKDFVKELSRTIQ